ncbi:MAG: AMP-binding protein [Sideroxyarcus sp.]|nr:AMP-binding protein [Sideroxyarcus sp.]
MILTSHPESAAQRVRARARQIHPQIVIHAETQLTELLETLPVLSKADLARHLPSDDRWLETAVLFSETSGTTGQPLQTPRGAGDLTWNAINQATAYRRFLQPGVDRVAILHPSILSPFIEASSMALRELSIGQVRVYPIPRVCDYRRIFDVLDRYRITTVMSTPSLVYKMLYEFTKLGEGRPPRGLKKLLLTGEELSPSSIRNLKQIMGSGALVAPFVYGSSEAATLMLGREDGLFDPVLDDFVFELQDSDEDDGKKLIVTWLRDGLMPILRYDTGDHFEVVPAKSPALRFLGRVGSNSVERKFRCTVERAVHSLDMPVFHYQGTFSETNRQLKVSVVVAVTDATLKPALEERLRECLPSWKATVDVNPESIVFTQFSPAPKTGKLTSC